MSKLTRTELSIILGWANYVRADQQASQEDGWDNVDQALYRKLVHDWRLTPPARHHA